MAFRGTVHLTVGLAILTLGVAAPARAGLLAYEGFNYPAGESLTNASASGDGGSFGWGGRWTGANGALATNAASSLGYIDPLGNALATEGGSVVIGVPAGTSANAQPSRSFNFGGLNAAGTAYLGLTNAATNYWASFVMQWIGPVTAGSTTNQYVRKGDFTFRSGALTNATSTGLVLYSVGSPNAANRIGTPPDTWATWTGADAAAGTQNTGLAASSVPLNAPTFVLVRLNLNGNAGNDTVYTWFNWTNLNTEPPLSAASTTNSSVNEDGLNNIRLDANGGNASGTNTVLAFDEFRLGNTFADVTPHTTNSSPAPAITSQPADATATAGDPAAFSVSAVGQAPLRYQWYFNTNTPLAGRTNAALTLDAVQTNDGGGYSVIVTNNSGSATSVVATLTVLPAQPPVITVQPVDWTNATGYSATFSVGATGSIPLRYQWYFNTNTPLANQTNAALAFTITGTNNAGGYSVIITNRFGSATSLVATLTVVPIVSGPFPAFPGADGAAKYATGGRGGIVYHVTKLDRNFSDAGPGTLRYGLADGNFPAGVPRTIVFDVGGVFWLGLYGAESDHDNGWNSGQSRYNLSGNTTLAGQTAPGPVVIMGGLTKAGSVNTIVRNMTFAPGYGLSGFRDPPNPPTPGDFPDSYVYDAIDISGQNILLDHLTTIYATDETISANELANNITIQYCNISQGQNYPQWDAEGGGYTGHALGSLLQGGSNFKFTIANNLYAHQKGRLPRVGSEVGTGAINDFRNNVFYNWLGTAGTGASGQPSYNNFIDNFYLAGDGGESPVGGTNTGITLAGGGTNIFDGASSSVTRAFVTGNLKDTNKDSDANDTSSADGSGNFSSTTLQSAAYDVSPGVTLSARNALTNVLRYVGARWWDRDYDFTAGNTNAINTPDERFIHETWTGTGAIMAWADDPFDSDPNEGVEWRSLLAWRADTNTYAAPFNRPEGWDGDQDGMPDSWELEHGLNPGLANNNGDFDNDGYTDLEEYLNDLAAWPAPGPIAFTGATNNRYAVIHNWQVSGEALNISGLGVVTTATKWQPSRYDTAVIANGTAVVDAVGQHAGTIRLATNGAANATLNIVGGWLEVSNTLEIAAAGTAAVNLSGGRLRAGVLTMGGGAGSFNFTGGTLSAGVVGFSLVNQGGVIAPGNGPGQTHVAGNLVLQGASVLELELGGTGAGASDQVVVDGNVTLAGTLNVTNLAGFGAGTYTLLTYGGSLSGSLAIGSMPAGYSWTLNTNTPGQVRLVVGDIPVDVEPPVFGKLQWAGTNLIFSGTGPTNGTYRALTSTNLALPLNLWTPVWTNLFDANGQFSFTNAIDPAKPQVFWRLLVP